MTKKIKSIAVLTSGGDSPGMNPAIRAIVRSAIGAGLDVYGINRGYQGLLKKDIHKLDASSVGNIIQKGGTILYTSRCLEFKKPEYRAKAAQILKEFNIDALIVIGGDGSFKGAIALSDEHGIPVIGIPGTIDNDISGTEYTIGFDTAVENAVEAIDKIRDTAMANDRAFLIEVMGARTSAIAVQVGICAGAENVLINGQEINLDEIASNINRGINRGKNFSVIIVAEGKTPGRAYDIAKDLEEKHNIKSRVCILGYIQRGGSPSVSDRFYASLMGKKAVEALLEGKLKHAIVVNKNLVEVCDLHDCSRKSDHVMSAYIDVAKTLAI
ncbi:MAG: 6-phosphofructokinase [Bacteriovoracaceae bacterium]|jgi:6-phosphofructokinase 1|nr:6-phosphofructokinase [Bacteriovoracaceae bacterium]